MAPIHDTDVASEYGKDRWSKLDWENYELWEKIEVRLRRRKWLWIWSAVAVFLAFSSIPILIDRWPKWTALSANRHLAQEIGVLKRQSGIEGRAFRLRFTETSPATYAVERADRCSDSNWETLRTQTLVGGTNSADFSLLKAEFGEKLGVPGLVDHFCYDALSGSDMAGESLHGFGILPVKDLTDRRIDRLSVLLIQGPSAELSFE